jgi:hypothetical protein
LLQQIIVYLNLSESDLFVFNLLFVILLSTLTIFNCNARIAHIDGNLPKKSNLECVKNSEFDLPFSTSSTEGSAYAPKRMVTELCNKKDRAKISLLAVSFPLFLQIILLLHECGHAAATKIFDSTANPQIYMWHNILENPSLSENEFFNLCGLRLKKNILSNGFSFFAGLTKNAGNPDKWKNIGIILAGGTTTLILGYLILIANAIWQKYKETKNLSQSIKFGFTNALTPYKNLFLNKDQSKIDIVLQLACVSMGIYVIIQSLLYTYFPTFSCADGSRAWGQIFKGKDQEICIPDISEQLSGQEIFGGVIMASIAIALVYKSVKTYEKYFNAYVMDKSKNVLDEIEVVPQN